LHASSISTCGCAWPGEGQRPGARAPCLTRRAAAHAHSAMAGANTGDSSPLSAAAQALVVGRATFSSTSFVDKLPVLNTAGAGSFAVAAGQAAVRCIWVLRVSCSSSTCLIR
jgi:hypothetical protein